MPNRFYAETRVVTWENTHWEGARVVLDSTGTAKVSLVIDVDRLFTTLGRKAAKSKGGKAVLHGGTITMRRK